MNLKRRSAHFTVTALSMLTLAIAFCGCSLAGTQRVADGASTSRSYNSVAGEVRVGRDATINNARNVAGTIDIGDRATTGSLKTVAGEIKVGEAVKVDGDVSTVAGEIRIGRGTRVSGEVATIAGEIRLDGCHVEGAVRLSQGSLRTRGAVVLSRGIVVRRPKPDDNDNRDPARVDIGPGADVASIEVEPDTEVDLRISSEARVGKITGATPTSY
jgi:acyl-[acyl carrier protein]--UDP-N-acetylglucosamine O-acyltransferase